MIDRIRSWFRRTPPTNEELEAQAEAKRIRDEMDTLRAGSPRSASPTGYTRGSLDR